MLKRISLGFGAFALLLAGLTMAIPEEAQALKCVPTAVPPGYQATGVACGTPRCPGEIWTKWHGGSVCVIYGADF